MRGTWESKAVHLERNKRANGNIFKQMGVSRGLTVSSLNSHLVCVLCSGYYVEATAIVECLHTFCRSCIVKYLQANNFCPICDVQIHQAKPWSSLRLDKTIQDLVYKVVPGLYQDEMRRRRQFYARLGKDADVVEGEAAGFLPNGARFFSHEDSISLSLEYYSGQSEDEEPESEPTAKQTNDKPKRYLQCPAAVTVRHLKKFLRMKYGIGLDCWVDIIYNDECLPENFSLIDVAYTFAWKRTSPMRFSYRIFSKAAVRKVKPQRNLQKCQTDEGEGKRSKHQQSLEQQMQNEYLGNFNLNPTNSGFCKTQNCTKNKSSCGNSNSSAVKTSNSSGREKRENRYLGGYQEADDASKDKLFQSSEDSNTSGLRIISEKEESEDSKESLFVEEKRRKVSAPVPNFGEETVDRFTAKKLLKNKQKWEERKKKAEVVRRERRRRSASHADGSGETKRRCSIPRRRKTIAEEFSLKREIERKQFANEDEDLGKLKNEALRKVFVTKEKPESNSKRKEGEVHKKKRKKSKHHEVEAKKRKMEVIPTSPSIMSIAKDALKLKVKLTPSKPLLLPLNEEECGKKEKEQEVSLEKERDKEGQRVGEKEGEGGEGDAEGEGGGGDAEGEGGGADAEGEIEEAVEEDKEADRGGEVEVDKEVEKEGEMEGEKELEKGGAVEVDKEVEIEVEKEEDKKGDGEEEKAESADREKEREDKEKQEGKEEEKEEGEKEAKECDNNERKGMLDKERLLHLRAVRHKSTTTTTTTNISPTKKSLIREYINTPPSLTISKVDSSEHHSLKSPLVEAKPSLEIMLVTSPINKNNNNNNNNNTSNNNNNNIHKNNNSNSNHKNSTSNTNNNNNNNISSSNNNNNKSTTNNNISTCGNNKNKSSCSNNINNCANSINTCGNNNNNKTNNNKSANNNNNNNSLKLKKDVSTEPLKETEPKKADGSSKEARRPEVMDNFGVLDLSEKSTRTKENTSSSSPPKEGSEPVERSRKPTHQSIMQIAQNLVNRKLSPILPKNKTAPESDSSVAMRNLKTLSDTAVNILMAAQNKSFPPETLKRPFSISLSSHKPLPSPTPAKDCENGSGLKIPVYPIARERIHPIPPVPNLHEIYPRGRGRAVPVIKPGQNQTVRQIPDPFMVLNRQSNQNAAKSVSPLTKSDKEDDITSKLEAIPSLQIIKKTTLPKLEDLADLKSDSEFRSLLAPKVTNNNTKTVHNGSDSSGFGVKNGEERKGVIRLNCSSNSVRKIESMAKNIESVAAGLTARAVSNAMINAK